ncbi:MAG: ribulose phosphate epimerase [Bacteroides sp. SM23_62_1]|nr:MAG: ribulose phosphate epimerase [Bacteroides sp. SM23_62_1]
MFEELKIKVYEANLELVKRGLVMYTWGNVSGIDREKGLVIIKPSGVSYDEMKPEDMVIVDLEGNVVDSKLKPSSDTPTHLVLYKAFKMIGGIAHSHSEWATSWAQAGRSIPVYGTTHADTFFGEVPCTRKMTAPEIRGKYERVTGNLIVETFKNIDPLNVPAVLVHGHGPFSWGLDPMDAVQHSVILEHVAKMAFKNELLGNRQPIDKTLLDKHFLRKHGKDAYYGQDEKRND